MRNSYTSCKTAGVPLKRQLQITLFFGHFRLFYHHINMVITPIITSYL